MESNSTRQAHFESREELRELLSAHLGKPEKAPLFVDALEKMFINNHLTFKPTWSWWAFLFSWAYLLYRRLYLYAGLFFLANLITGLVGLNIAVMIAAGISAKYLYLKKFLEDLQKAGHGRLSGYAVRKNLEQLGGYHPWVIWVMAALAVVSLLGIAIL
ncbi:DUF2628 domain-containing protein [Desulfurispira natronophila]|uniref:DUF2628 domain-containing protein n=1 Tax=Desulfurispira natronophila TaxID=682562 RepID=A0A7W7Y452_9BACT|nr:DUF2628 domain-containing protein [Desulfurispira natronophila]MBB5021594.1 hypothetical protein [Desulfurispira natronophila]